MNDITTKQEKESLPDNTPLHYKDHRIFLFEDRNPTREWWIEILNSRGRCVWTDKNLKSKRAMSESREQILKQAYNLIDDEPWNKKEQIEDKQKSIENKIPNFYADKLINGVKVDFYKIAELYDITDQAIGHALKKLLRCGRSHKNEDQDIQDVIDTLVRKQELKKEKKMIIVNGNKLIEEAPVSIGKVGDWPPQNMMTTFERMCIVALAAKFDRGLAKLEIGTYEGFTTFCLAKAFPDSTIYTVDLLPEVNHKEQPGTFLGHHYKSNKCSNVVQILRYSSQQDLLINQRIDFALIDGDHSYESVKQDFNESLNLLGGRGIIVLDDSNLEGPRDFINQENDMYDWFLIKDTKLAYTLI